MRIHIPKTNRFVRLSYQGKNVQIKAQNAVIALATASICNAELCIFFNKIVDKPIRLGYNHMILVILVLFCSTQMGIAQQELLQSGPMVGYSSMREVALWVQTKAPAKVKIRYWEKDSLAVVYETAEVETSNEQVFTAHLIADKVQPGKKYAYEVLINSVGLHFDYPLSFQTQTFWNDDVDPPDVKFIAGSCFFVNEKKYDYPGTPYGSEYGILESMVNEEPDFMLWLGDNVYLKAPDWNTRTGIEHRYTHTRSLPELQALLASTHHYAIWDDHDYGANDALGTFWAKDITKETFQRFWANPNYDLAGDGGITGNFFWSDCQFILLDNRWNRSYPETNGHILGQKQLEWLITMLRSSPYTFKFICVGGQLLSDVALFENHAVYSQERDRFLDQVDKYDISGVVILNGDRHSSEVSRMETEKGNVFYELTSSSLTAKAYDHSDEPNTYRVEGSMIGQHNYAVVEVKGKPDNRKLFVNFKDMNGRTLFSYDFKFPVQEKVKNK